MQMNQFIVFIIILIPLLLILWLTYHFNQKQIKQVISGEKSLDDSHVWLRNTSPIEARVISKQESLNPEAVGIAKVDLGLEIQLPDGGPVQVSTCWLVEIPSLPLLAPGMTLMVKFDPKKTKQVYPAVPWARAWLFGK
jgi:hypothetical protein